MFSNQTAEASLNIPIRALTSVRSDKVDSRFVVGSCSVARSGGYNNSNNNIDDENHLQVLRFHPEVNQLSVDVMLQHPTGPVKKICTSPIDKSMMLTLADDNSSGGNNSNASATLWKVPREVMDRNNDVDFDIDGPDDLLPGGGNMTPMQELATLGSDDKSKKVVDIQWRGGFDEEPSGLGDVLTLDEDGTITQWDVSLGTAEQARTQKASSSVASESTWNLPPKMAWDPHNVDAVAVSSGSRISLFDWRANNTAMTMTTTTNNPTTGTHSFQCHRYGITDLDYNPNKPHVLTTAGQDGLLKFWDLRSTQHPLLVIRGGHRHWVSQVSYNPFHDQLVISAGTDSLVNLWRVSTISSAPLLTWDDDDGAGAVGGAGDDGADIEPSGPNVRVSQYEHMDSVLASTWSASDAWVYVTASFDGKVVLNHVPSKEKYKILL